MFFYSRFYDAVWRRFYRFFGARKVDVRIPGGAISFTFDDFPVTAATNGARLLEAFGWRGTYYVAPALLESQSSSVGKIASMQDVLQLASKNHEIGAHTNDHVSCVGLAKSEIEQQVRESRDRLKQIGSIEQFAFPFGASDDRSRYRLARHYVSLRGVSCGVNSGGVDKNALRANPIYSPVNLEEIKTLVKKAKSDNGWLIFYTHDVNESPSKFGCTPEEFEDVLNIVRRIEVQVTTISELTSRLVAKAERSN